VEVARAVRTKKVVRFGAADPAEVVGYMDLLSEARDGWINVQPEKDTDEETTTLGFFTLFGGGNPGITMSTWIPEAADQTGRQQVSLGIAHAAGRRLSAQPSAVAIPTGWHVKQDHPQRGLVLSIPDDEPNGRVLEWALAAMRSLSPPASAGVWRAEIYLPANS
jgi:hypothetical protein